MSTIGQFGFIEYGLDFKGLKEKFNISENLISKIKPREIRIGLNESLYINDQKAIDTLASKSETILRELIIENRRKAMNRIFSSHDQIPQK